jgi:hypothetical protein
MLVANSVFIAFFGVTYQDMFVKHGHLALLVGCGMTMGWLIPRK